MGTEENKVLMQRHYHEVWGKGNLAVSAQMVAQDVVDHMLMPGRGAGRMGHDAMVAMIAAAFPDRKFTTHHLIAEGDKVVGHWTMTATHKGPIMSVPATGKPVTMGGIDIARWENSKLQEIWHIEDAVSMLQQMGVIPGM